MEQLIGLSLRKVYDKTVLMSLFLISIYTEHIMRNAGLDELQAGIKIGVRNINNFWYVDNTTLVAESKEELEPPDEGEGAEWKSWLKLKY